VAAPDFRVRPLADTFLYRGLVRVNAYKCAKFQVPVSISYRDMEGIPDYKMGAADLPRRPLAVKFLYVAMVPANAYQRTKFQLSSSISFGDMREVANKKWQLLISPDAPSGQIFIPGASTRKCLQVCQISSSYLH